MFQPAETDSDEDARVRRAVVTAAGNLARAMRHIPHRKSYEYALLHRQPESFDATDTALINRLGWHYRRQLPEHLRPDNNPDDRIIRERLLNRV